MCGSWLWLATEAVLCTVWWLILFWLVFVIFGSCLWYGAAYTVQGVLSNTMVVARQVADAKANTSSPPPMPGSPSVSPLPPGSTLASLSPPPPLNPGLTCDAGCLNLALFDFLVGVSDVNLGYRCRWPCMSSWLWQRCASAMNVHQCKPSAILCKALLDAPLHAGAIT